MIQLGFGKGDRVGMLGANSLQWALTQFATARIGAILVSAEFVLSANADVANA